jgi:hypothetical protein
MKMVVTTSTTVTASWVKAGFEYCKRDGLFYLVVNDGKMRDSPDFSEILPVNYPIEAYRPPGTIRERSWHESILEKVEVSEVVLMFFFAHESIPVSIEAYDSFECGLKNLLK